MSAEEYVFDEELGEKLRKIIKKFPDSFGHINHKKVLPLTSSKESKYVIAEVRKIPAHLHGILPYRVALIVYENKYGELSKASKNLVLVHELEHIQPHLRNDDDFTLKRHTVEDWFEMVNHLGPGWSSRIDFDIMKSDATSWQEAVASPDKRKKKKKVRK